MYTYIYIYIHEKWALVCELGIKKLLYLSKMRVGHFGIVNFENALLDKGGVKISQKNHEGVLGEAWRKFGDLEMKDGGANKIVRSENTGPIGKQIR